MSQTLEATFDGEVFRPIDAVELKPDTRVRLIVTDQSTADAFQEWQSLLTSDEDEDCRAIQQALDEMDAGGSAMILRASQAPRLTGLDSRPSDRPDKMLA
jgi:predicted DNA-binding antitoxin AbrB/MazE fold protein